MSISENPPPKDNALGRISRALTTLSTTEGEIGDATKNVITKLQKNEITFIPSEGTSPLIPVPSAPISFDLLRFISSGRGSLIPGILFNPRTVAEQERMVQLELIPPIIIANSYPEKYSGRLVPLYHDALNVQAEWLNQQTDLQGARIALDPRGDIDDITRKLVGNARYECDTGFSDWTTAIDDLLLSAPPDRASLLNKLRNNEKTFLILRHLNTDNIYQNIIGGKLKDDFLQMEPDDKAAIVASRLVQIDIT